MGFFNLKCFELEKKSDGLYRCKGGHFADIVFLTCGIFYCLGLAILEPFKEFGKYIKYKITK